MDQELLNKYFSSVWKPSTSGFGESGFDLAKEIADDEWVLDVGCGYHPYKDLIKNIVGIDPANDAADHKVRIEDFETDRRFDVAFCLGSLNFGTRNTINDQITKVVSFLKPKSRIYWRCNPGNYDHGNEMQYEIDFFPWRDNDHYTMAPQWGYTATTVKRDSGYNNRIFAVWRKE